MIEKIILDYLNDELDVKVYMERPSKPTGKYVIMEKTGSSRFNMINRATLAVQSYADSMEEAAILNEAVKEKMYAAVRLNDVCKVSLNSDYNFTDTAMKKYRYQAVFDIVHY